MLGRTEVVNDSLSPQYKNAIRIRYSCADVPSEKEPNGVPLVRKCMHECMFECMQAHTDVPSEKEPNGVPLVREVHACMHA